MLFAAMVLTCWPILRSSVSSRSEIESEQTLYNARILEIEKDLELGRLDEISAEAAKAEEARRLIKASENSKTLIASSKNRLLIIIAVISLPALSLPIYYDLGTPEIVNPPQVTQSPSDQPSMEELLQIAEKRLAENPDDVNGWKAVAPVYVRLGRFKDAESAYKNILRVEGRSPEFLLRLADVYIEEKRGQVDERARFLIDEILSIDKHNATALFYTGIIALQDNNEDETLRIWQGMVDEAKGDEEWLPVITSRIEELKTLQSRSQLPALDNETLKAAEEMSAEDRAEMVSQMVANLAERLEANPDDKAGWERLIRAYMILQRRDDALVAVGKASQHFAEDSEFVSSLRKMVSKSADNQGDG